LSLANRKQYSVECTGKDLVTKSVTTFSSPPKNVVQSSSTAAMHSCNFENQWDATGYILNYKVTLVVV
jgi:hypothetical protein